MVRIATPPAVLALELAQVQPFDDLDDVARQMALGQPLLHRGWQEKVNVAVDRAEAAHRVWPSGSVPLFYTATPPARGRESPTGC